MSIELPSTLPWPSLTEIAKGSAKFLYYKDKTLWYECRPYYINVAWRPFIFPIPVDDAGEGEFRIDMKGTEILRWARKQLEIIRTAQTEQQKNV